ncbi:MAG: efflux RND transporter periplasmic adaptor subunit [Hyphomicrobiaceae bacterium]|nr:efflux RND transporter periplasmic adaptor subunit [Hyphomicrobiaceae bacterium]MDX2450630.1 efflux RND transporter periplasmic adaptor subunit [Hyphomicrobiaceae bacterium]
MLVWLKILPNKLWTWLSAVAWVVLLFVVLFIPMQWGAPAGSARILTYTVQIIPNVAGPVLEVPVEANRPIKKGDVLFTIDPTTYEAALEATQAQLDFQEVRLQQYEKLASTAAGTRFQVEETAALVKQLTAELEGAEWNLNETTVRAPADGYVTYLALRPGQRVVTLPFQPAMTFVDTSREIVGVQIQQIHQRYIKRGQEVEMAFKTQPGRIYTGKVKAIIQVTHKSQAVISGTVPTAQPIQAEPFFVRVQLDDREAAKDLPAGTAGTAAIYTKSAAMTHIIRKVMIRMESYMNYIIPWL